MMTETRTRTGGYHNRESGRLRAKNESTPHARPAAPIAKPREARTGTSSSQIHDVPNSEIQRLPRNRNATNAEGRVNNAKISRIPTVISVRPCIGAAIEAWFAARPITAFQIAGEWLFSM